VIADVLPSAITIADCDPVGQSAGGRILAIKQTSKSSAVLLSVRDFADRMGISPSTARKLCYSRAVATVKFNKSLLVPAEEIDRLISENLTPALSAAE
jgi:hypothetical protein